MEVTLAQRMAAIVRDAGGRVVGRTKLQKLTFLLLETGFEEPGIQFAYKHYGPFSETVAAATREAHLLDLLEEREEHASWGGSYSIFLTDLVADPAVPESRVEFANAVNKADAVELELAATALFLFNSGVKEDVWNETERRKPEKALGGRLQKAKQLYDKLMTMDMPKKLPQLH